MDLLVARCLHWVPFVFPSSFIQCFLRIELAVLTPLFLRLPLSCSSAPTVVEIRHKGLSWNQNANIFFPARLSLLPWPIFVRFPPPALLVGVHFLNSNFMFVFFITRSNSGTCFVPAAGLDPIPFFLLPRVPGVVLNVPLTSFSGSRGLNFPLLPLPGFSVHLGRTQSKLL